MLRYVILGLLRGVESRHGYELTTEYRARTGARLNVGNVYRELGQLAQNGLVVSVNGNEVAHARRIPYRITSKGCEVFDRWLLSRPGSPEEFLHRLPFLDRLPQRVRESLLDEFENHLVVRGHLLREERHGIRGDEALRTKNSPPAAAPLLLDRRLKQIELELDFLKTVRTTFCGPRPLAEASASGMKPQRSRGRPERANR